MSPQAGGGVRYIKRFPRVSGDEPNRSTDALLDPEFSPRERG